jgi:acyl-CoA thioester hydrolase
MYYGGDVEIRSYITHIGNSSFTIGHEAWQDEELKAKGKAVLVHYDFINQVPLVIPDETRAELEANFVKEEDIGKK